MLVHSTSETTLSIAKARVIREVHTRVGVTWVASAILSWASLVKLLKKTSNATRPVLWEIHALSSVPPAFGPNKQVKEIVAAGQGVDNSNPNVGGSESGGKQGL